MKKVFKVAHIRDLEHQVSKGEISYSRMVEIMNEMAFDSYEDVVDSRVSREDQINNGLMHQDEPKDSAFVSYVINFFPGIYKFLRWRYMKFIEKDGQ